MNENQLQIIAEAKIAVTEIFQNKVNPLFVFHNLEHTIQVVNAAGEIGAYYQLADDDQFVLFISAWFHDTGFSSGRAEEHEKESSKLATDFLLHSAISQELLFRIISCIEATHLPQQPVNLVAEIICDADLHHLGTNMFSTMSDRLRREYQACYKNDLSEEEWRQLDIKFLKSHKYFTGYCREKLEPVKLNWIKQLQNKKVASS